VTSVYQETTVLNLLTVENWRNYINYLQSNPDIAPHLISSINLCELKLHLSRYFDLTPQIAVNKQRVCEPTWYHIGR
jgi:hypothetical protein